MTSSHPGGHAAPWLPVGAVLLGPVYLYAASRALVRGGVATPSSAIMVLGAGVFVCAAVAGATALRQRHMDARVARRFGGLLLVGGAAVVAIAGHLVNPWVATGLWVMGTTMVGAGASPLVVHSSVRSVVSGVVLAALGAGLAFALPGLLNGVSVFAAVREWAFTTPSTWFSVRGYLLLGVVWSLAGGAAMSALDDARPRSDGDAQPQTRRHPEALLEVSGLSTSYGKVQILFDVAIHVAEGEAVALLGTNGAGKSTLLRTIFGLKSPDSGRVWFDGADVTRRPSERLVSLGMAQVPGGRGIFPSLTVLENLRMAAYAVGDQERAKRGIDRALGEFPSLASRADEPAGVLSGGEQQMLALSRAWITRPRLLAIDELTLGLAPQIVDRLLVFVDMLREEGTALLLVEQSVNTALRVVDRAYFMERGSIRFDGKATDLLERPDLLRSVFLEGAVAGSGSS